MVCENRRLRSLLVSRRGGFLEDPFFRDAWGDYHNAVRRIVDRFNHGMFAPRDRLRDSHYDSMYRTLRSARINLAAQSARFKDEGSYYKLVMDVREFLGGQVTVRTAGGTVSVRGRFESGAGDDAATTHSGSSRASSARTLHRRFNLPPDADGEKVASTLSRDAVLTVTIPKRTDVRVIPVTVEKDGSTASGRSGTKRHSGTHYDQGPTPNKRTQDHRPQNHTHASHRSPETPYEETRDTFRMGGSQEDLRNYNDRLNRRDREGAATGTKDRDARRNSELFNRSGGGGGAGGGGGLADEKEVRRRSYPEGSLWRGGERVVNSQENKENCTRNGRGRDITEEELEDNPSGQRSRRRAQKYEEAKEFNIPIRIEETGGSDIIFQYPAASNAEPENTPKANVLLNTNSDSSYKNTDHLKSNARFSHQPSSHQTKEEKSQPRPLSSTVPDQVSMAPPKDISNIRSNFAEEKENIKPAKDEPAWVYSDLHSRGNQNDLTRTNVPNVSAPDSDKENKQYSAGDKSTDNTRLGLEIRVESPGGTRVGQEKKIKESKAPEEDKTEKLNSSNVTPDKVQNNAINPQTEKPEGTKDYLRNVSQESASPDDRSKSPVGGREVMVEKKQSDMEGDMFNDCWQNFSSTLHEVLARLQELSAELGHGRPSTTPSSSPPTGEDISADTTPECKPIKQNQQAKPIINSQVPNKESQQREINEYHVPVTIEGSEWVAGGRGSAAVGVGGRTPTSTTSTTTTAASRVHEGERSATRSGTTNQPNIESSSYKLSEAGLGSSIERDSPESQSDLRASDTATSSVPWRGSSGGRSGSNGGALARDNVKTASLVPDDTEHQTSSVRQHVPMSFIDGVVDRASQVSDSRGDDGQRYAEHLSPGARRRPSSLNIAQEGSLLKNLRKSSPVDALKDKFLSHVTPTSECSVNDKDVYYVPVELEARKTVVSAANDSGGPKNTTPASRPVASTTAAATIPLCERRGKGIDNLVIIDPDRDHQYSNSSDSASTTASDATSEVSSSVDFGDVDADSGRRKLHLGRRQQQNNNSADAVGNSRVLNAAAVGPAQFQEQESSSDGSGAALRGSYPLDAIVRGSVSGGSWPKPRPRTPSTHQSDSDPDVDELISHAERVIEETKRLSASITNEAPFENNLDQEKKETQKRKPVINSKLKGFNLAPNIDTRGTSPDSNFVEVEEEEDEDKGEEKEEVRKQREGEEEVIVKGCLSIPLPEAATSSTTTTTTTSRPRKPRHKSPPESPPSPPPFLADTHYTNAAKPATRSDSLLIEEVDDDSDDVIASEELRPTIVTSPEIQSSDVMGCEREGGRGSRSEVPLGGPREARPRTLAHEAQPNRAPRRGSSRERMGSVFSRGRSEDSTRQRPLSPSGGVSGKPKVASPTQQTPSTPSTPLRANSRLKSPSEERQVPPYVKQKPEPSRRYSGFAHVQSDNVRKMRDVWGSKQEPPPQPPQRGNRVPASPPPVSRRAPDSPGGPRRAPDSPGFRNTPDSPSLRRAVPDPPGYRRAPDSPGYRRAPDSPGYRRAPDSPGYRKAPDSPGYRRAPDSPGYRRAPDSPGPRRGSDSSGPRRAPDSPAPRRGSDSTGPRRAPDSPCPRRVQDPPVPKRSTDSPSSRAAPDLSGLRQGPDSPRRSSFSRDTKSPSRTNNYHNSTFSSRSRSSSSPCRGSSNSGTEGGATTTKPSRTKDATSRNAAPAAANSARSAADKFRAGGSPGPRASPTRRTSTPPPPSSRSTPPASPFHHKLFRRLRDASLQPDSETICFTEEEDRYKLVMDVEEYVPGEIEVLQDDKLLTVKGRVQTTSHGNTTTRTFSRNFDIPHNTREEDIDSALSKDGILTVYVPKKRERVIKIELTD